jgi:hypothetical protein
MDFKKFLTFSKVDFAKGRVKLNSHAQIFNQEMIPSPNFEFLYASYKITKKKLSD